jgi:hypothetical protein
MTVNGHERTLLEPRWRLGSWIRGFDSHGVYAWLGAIYENARVISEEHDVAGRILKVRGLPSAIARLKRALADS